MSSPNHSMLLLEKIQWLESHPVPAMVAAA